MTKKEKIFYVLKKHAYMAVFGVLTLVLIIAIIASSGEPASVPTGSGNVNTNNNLNTTPTPAPLTMGLPVANATVTKYFSNTELQYNETLKQYEAHLGVDFSAVAGSKVCAVFDGSVIEVGNNYLKGNYVIIQHNNGLKSVYSSLAENIAVAKGDNVAKGDIIGVVGSSAYGELEEGNHLHFELLDNDTKIDPAGYLDIDNK